jgi:hypothetical protein
VPRLVQQGHETERPADEDDEDRDHEVEEGAVPGVVVSRVNMSQQFAGELLAALQEAYSKYTTVKGIQDLPETDDR